MATMLTEQIRDPRVKGSPFSDETASSTITENFNWIIPALDDNDEGYKLQYTAKSSSTIAVHLQTWNLDASFVSGTSKTVSFEAPGGHDLWIGIYYDGKRTIYFQYENNENAIITETATISYIPSKNRYIKTRRVDFSTGSPFLSPSLYVYGKLNDSGAVSETNLASNSITTVKIKDLNVTTAKLANTSVTTGKLAAQSVTWAKLSTSLTELKTSGNQSYQPPRWKWSIS